MLYSHSLYVGHDLGLRVHGKCWFDRTNSVYLLTWVFECRLPSCHQRGSSMPTHQFLPPAEGSLIALSFASALALQLRIGKSS